MPRKTKEQKELEIEKKVNEKTDKTEKKSTSTTPKKASQKKSTKTVAKTSTGKKRTATTKAITSKAATAKATTKATSKKTVTEKTVEETKKVTKKSTSTSTTKKASKTATKKPSSTAKTTRKKKVSNPKDKKIDIVEYYDLPYRYNQTVIKLLAQTPKTLFIYWDISDDDREKYKEQYGEDFFETTRPVLIVHNDSLNYSFEVEINDFANSWYLHVSDSKCDYRIELGRRPIQKTEKLNTDYIYISASNEIESPNDRILFNKEQKMVYFRNVKTGEQTSKPINTLNFIRNMGKIYNIYDIYKAIYQDENIEELYDLSNPSSGNPSSR